MKNAKNKIEEKFQKFTRGFTKEQKVLTVVEIATILVGLVVLLAMTAEIWFPVVALGGALAWWVNGRHREEVTNMMNAKKLHDEETREKLVNFLYYALLPRQLQRFEIPIQPRTVVLPVDVKRLSKIRQDVEAVPVVTFNVPVNVTPYYFEMESDRQIRDGMQQIAAEYLELRHIIPAVWEGLDRIVVVKCFVNGGVLHLELVWIDEQRIYEYARGELDSCAGYEAHIREAEDIDFS